MAIKHLWRERVQLVSEEIASSVSHGVGLLGALTITPIMIVIASRRSGARGIVAASIFGATIILLYLMSTLYHALPTGRAKRVFQVLDHSAIYVLIAGTYTPVTLVVLRGVWGWSLFGVIWGLAALGILLKALGRLQHPTLSTILYVAMGWIAVVAIRPLWLHLPPWGIFWLAAGGFAYTLGVGFFMARGVRFHHLIWHLFVIAGTTCHFIAVMKYAI